MWTRTVGDVDCRLYPVCRFIPTHEVHANGIGPIWMQQLGMLSRGEFQLRDSLEAEHADAVVRPVYLHQHTRREHVLG